MELRYQIFRVSARTVLGYAKAEDGGRYSFSLDANATRRCLAYDDSEQEDNALFYQILCVLHGGQFSLPAGTHTCTELAGVIFYMDFAGIFGRSDAETEKKAESLFRPEGITMDFGGGAQRYLAFERSGSMSRQTRLSFLRADLYEEVRRRIMLDMTVGLCQLSKLYAYNGLMLSSGVRINGIDLARPGRVIVVENAEFTARAKVITVQGEPVRGRQTVSARSAGARPAHPRHAVRRRGAHLKGIRPAR